jgi:branched-chain amino acid transport system substrate-binding protein
MSRTFGFRPSTIVHALIFVLRTSLSCCLPALSCPFWSAASPAEVTNQPVPFFRFRERPLEYNGPERDEGEPRNLKEAVIGWFGPCETTNYPAGDAWWAAKLAVREANEQGGVRGLFLRLAPRWAVDPWGTGVSQLTRMIYTEHPLALLGSIDSPSTHLAEQVVAKAQLLLISPVTTDKSVTLAGVPWMFACAPTDDVIARVLVNDVLAKLGNRKIALLNATDHESRMTASEVVKEFSGRRRPVDFRFEVSPGALAITSQMEALGQLRPGAVLVVAGAEDAARIVVSTRDATPGSLIFGSHSMGRACFLRLAGRAADGIRFPLLFVPAMDDPTTRRFVRQFKADQAHEPDYTAALAYDATWLLVEALRRGGLNRARIREAVLTLSPWNGITGMIRWDGTGQNTRTDIRMGAIRNGVVAPAD